MATDHSCPDNCPFCNTDKAGREQAFQDWLAKLERRNGLTRRND